MELSISLLHASPQIPFVLTRTMQGIRQRCKSRRKKRGREEVRRPTLAFGGLWGEVILTRFLVALFSLPRVYFNVQHS